MKKNRAKTGKAHFSRPIKPSPCAHYGPNIPFLSPSLKPLGQLGSNLPAASIRIRHADIAEAALAARAPPPPVAAAAARRPPARTGGGGGLSGGGATALLRRGGGSGVRLPIRDGEILWFWGGFGIPFASSWKPPP